MHRILVVEDEANIRKLLVLNLELEGFEVDTATNGLEALERVKQAYYDLMVLDLMLPEIDGMKVLQNIRLSHPNLPVIIVSARDTSTDRIQGLKTGADDYLVKPFNVEELVLRINKLIDRQIDANQVKQDIYKFGECEINFDEYMIKTSKGHFKMTKKESLLLRLFIDHPNAVISREQMLKNVWGYDVFPSTRTIDNFILSLRKYFETDLKNPKHFHSIRGVGYKFTP